MNINVADILINNFIDGRGACYLAYSPPSNTLYLVNDNGEAGGPFSGSLVLGNFGTIENSQCAVTLVSAGWNGAALNVTINFAFKPAFAGNKIVYLGVSDLTGYSTGWQAAGIWQVPGPQITTTAVVGASGGAEVLPGIGGPGDVEFTFSDTKGSQDIGVVNILVGTVLDGHGTCYVAYDRRVNRVYLVNDNGDALIPALPTAGPLFEASNSQCSVAVEVTASGGNTLTLSVGIQVFSITGLNQIIWAAARDVNESNNTGWQAVGLVTFCHSTGCAGG